MLSDIPAQTDDRVLVDFRTADDAGVYRWEGGPALVQTVDFFTPIVDDPYVYGQIAAANAVSDIYAMGGRPLTALAIAAFPKEGLEPATIRAIFQGGFDKLREAGVSLLGGHTVQDQEIKFGYAVTGAIDPARVLTNAGAKPGDVLFLTKPLGTGIVGTAIKFDRADAGARRRGGAVDADAEPRRGRGAAGAAGRRRSRVHRHHRLRTDRPRQRDGARPAASRCAIDAGRGPAVRRRAGDRRRRTAPAGWRRTRSISSEWRHGRAGQSTPTGETLLYDPQTSGGLLIAASAEAADAVEAALRAARVPRSAIGAVGRDRPACRSWCGR